MLILLLCLRDPVASLKIQFDSISPLLIGPKLNISILTLNLNVNVADWVIAS